jgi:hypothetical protein
MLITTQNLDHRILQLEAAQRENEKLTADNAALAARNATLLASIAKRRWRHALTLLVLQIVTLVALGFSYRSDLELRSILLDVQISLRRISSSLDQLNHTRPAAFDTPKRPVEPKQPLSRPLTCDPLQLFVGPKTELSVTVPHIARDNLLDILGTFFPASVLPTFSKASEISLTITTKCRVKP